MYLYVYMYIHTHTHTHTHFPPAPDGEQPTNWEQVDEDLALMIARLNERVYRHLFLFFLFHYFFFFFFSCFLFLSRLKGVGFV